MRKGIVMILLALGLTLAGCSHHDNDNKESSTKSDKSSKTDTETVKIKDDDKMTDKEKEYKELEKKASKKEKVDIMGKLDPLVTEKSLTNKTGMQGWKDYKELMKKVEIADYNYVKESKGASMKEVDDFFKDKKGVKRKEIKNPGGLKQIDYWYVDPSGKKIGKSNIPEFYAEILTKYKDGKLVYASIEPGFYTADFAKALDGDRMKDIKTLNQLVAPKPVSYGIGQMKYSGIPLVNVSVIAKAPAKKKEDQVPVLAFYTFSPFNYNSDKEPQVAYLSGIEFMSGSRDFGNSNYLSMMKFIKEQKEVLDQGVHDS
ncbi:hypothetical protein [Staphylococcus lugdunensis]|uniref:hypothetical protein n=1 Tax=Staphylococcus lugdunensis TaxID=28035 RepID=UPI001F576A90|nr:hypothetical protein [Staphylococcus lugdunensis]MCI2764609.1 hypothetical protein [Staphylococcus lugdunensis]MCI2801422.1 hypothetical protein [Staphylococcus lugdunensis]